MGEVRLALSEIECVRVIKARGLLEHTRNNLKT
jgi:hypothetical protein